MCFSPAIPGLGCPLSEHMISTHWRAFQTLRGDVQGDPWLDSWKGSQKSLSQTAASGSNRWQLYSESCFQKDSYSYTNRRDARAVWHFIAAPSWAHGPRSGECVGQQTETCCPEGNWGFLFSFSHIVPSSEPG